MTNVIPAQNFHQ